MHKSEMKHQKTKITLLGTGTSQGVPVMGCKCEVCVSPHAKDKRLRTSVLITHGDTNLVIDCGPDFRQQMLQQNVDTLDAVLLTHEHQDHVAGLDELRSYIFKQKLAMPIFAEERVLRRVKTLIPYAFTKQPYPGAPTYNLNSIVPGPLHIHGVFIKAIRALHGNLPVLGFRIKNFAYLTDVNFISEEAIEQLQDLEVLVLDALHHNKHHAHFNLQEALEIANEISAQKTYFTHISHSMGLHEVINKKLPVAMALAYDGLSFNFG